MNLCFTDFSHQTLFTDLSKDPTLFTGQGDYQFDVYRLMQAKTGQVY